MDAETKEKFETIDRVATWTDFQNPQLAFDHVWQKAFDEGLRRITRSPPWIVLVGVFR
jgi:hypothetical protein